MPSLVRSAITYRLALAVVSEAQQHQPLAALFGAANVSSSDGQYFLTAGPGEVLGAHKARSGLTGERLHGDDTTVPVLARGRTTTAKLNSIRSLRLAR